MAVIDRTTLTADLYETSFSLDLPPHLLKINPENIVDAAVVKTLEDTGATMNLSLKISEDMTDIRKRLKARQTKLLRDPRLIQDGKKWLISGVNLEWWLNEIEMFKKEVEIELSVFHPDRVREIREECQERSRIQIESSLLSRIASTNLKDDEIAEVCDRSSQLFIDQSFPDVSEFTTSWSVTSDIPRLALTPLPAGLSAEAVATLEAKRVEQMKRLWDVLIHQYDELEVRAASGLYHERCPEICYVTEGIHVTVKEAQDAYREMKTLRKEGGELEMGDGKVKESMKAFQFGKTVAQMILRQSEPMATNLKGCEGALEALAGDDPSIAAKYDAMITNLAHFATCSREWIKEYNQLERERKAGKLGESQVMEDIEDDLEDDGDTGETIDVDEPPAVMVMQSEIEDVIEDGDDEIVELPLVEAKKRVKKPIALRRRKREELPEVDEDDDDSATLDF